jgi:hypothetical protein
MIFHKRLTDGRQNVAAETYILATQLKLLFDKHFAVVHV